MVTHACDYMSLLEAGIRYPKMESYLGLRPVIVLINPRDQLDPSEFPYVDSVVAGFLRTTSLYSLGELLCPKQLWRWTREFPYTYRPTSVITPKSTIANFTDLPLGLSFHLSVEPRCALRANQAITRFALLVKQTGSPYAAMNETERRRRHPFGAVLVREA